MAFITRETETRIAEAVEETAEPRMIAAYDPETRTGICVFADRQDGGFVAAKWAVAGPMLLDQLGPFSENIRQIWSEELARGLAHGVTIN